MIVYRIDNMKRIKPDLKTSCCIWNLSFDLNAISASATELSPRMSSLCCFVFEASI